MKIVTYPNPILQNKAQAIDLRKFPLGKLVKINRIILKTMYQHRGVGLAAPQVNLNLRLCAINKKAASQPKDLFLINPIITARSIEQQTLEEGCLSIPNVPKEIARSKWVEVQAQDLDGNLFNFKAENLFARILQHEIDHLDGILIVDK